MKSDCQNLVDSYLRWLRKRTEITQINGVCEITTPFLDRHNDRLQIYVYPEGNGLRLTDDGYIIGDLESTGCAIDTASRRQMFETIVQGFGVAEDGGELTVLSSPADFPQKKHALLQAMLAVNDMFVTAKRHVASLFVEDVARFLDDNAIRYIKKIQIQGRSGFTHHFDFGVPKSSQAPERLAKVINNPTKQNGELAIFAWDDTKAMRDANSMFYVFLNDDESPVRPELLTALREYEVTPIVWSEREQHLQHLVA